MKQMVVFFIVVIFTTIFFSFTANTSYACYAYNHYYPPYASGSCSCGTKIPDCNGGTCPSAFCHPAYSANCPCGCNADCYGGSCRPGPTSPSYCGVCGGVATCGGGYCNPGPSCNSTAIINCPCGCTPTCSGGSCTVCGPAPTSPPAGPTEPTIPSGTCTFDQLNEKICSSDGANSLICRISSGSYNWQIYQTCVYGPCTNGACPADSGQNYCTRTCGCNGSTKNALVKCYHDSTMTGTVLSSSCVYIGSDCANGCSPISETCGGSAVCPDGLVSHIDNCSQVNCAAPCGPTPGTGGGTCSPDCSNAINICSGNTYSDPTGCGTCSGIKSCTGTITARAVPVFASDKSCSTITASSDYLSDTIISFSPELSPVSQTQTTTPLTWSDVTTTGTTVYTVSGTPPAQHALGNTCVSQNGGAFTQASSGTLTDGGTLDFAIGYISQAGWFQTSVGNIYGKTLVSSIPATATQPYLSLAGSGGSAGIAMYGTSYDFSLSSSDTGESQVSPTGWLVQNSATTVDWYERIKRRLDVPGTGTTLSTIANITKPSCSQNPCIFYANGDLSTLASTPWNIDATEQIVVVVNGAVTINAPITITPGGFFAIVANGNITIDPSVGTTASSTTTNLEGLYIATNSTHTAVFFTGDSASTGHERINIKGTVLADTISLQRNLGASNATYPGESFTFNPQLLFTMPDILKDTPYVWQEVAP